MKNPPASPTDAQVLEVVQREWDAHIDEVAHSPAGFGAHHWVGQCQGEVVLFITLDSPADPDILEQTYAAAAELNHSRPGIAIAPIQAASARYTVALDSKILSVTPWMAGTTPKSRGGLSEAQHLRVKSLLMRLHSTPAPASLQAWEPAVDAEFASQLSELIREPWTSGPQGEVARELISSRLQDITRRVKRFQELVNVAEAQRERWLPTHGEPHFANQIWTGDAVRLVDWESFRLAPPERDLREIPPRLRDGLEANADMLEMFHLEWILSEIAEYAKWFRAPHVGNEDDLAALENLRIELGRN